jgi:hypothetical protein
VRIWIPGHAVQRSQTQERRAPGLAPFGRTAGQGSGYDESDPRSFSTLSRKTRSRVMSASTLSHAWMTVV